MKTWTPWARASAPAASAWPTSSRSWQEEKVGRTVQVICDGYDDENDLYICRTRADAPDIDAECCVRSETPLEPGAFYRVTIEESDVYDLYGALAES